MTAISQKLSFLIDHQSIPANQLVEPAPSAEQLDAILQSAMSAPDHAGLQPFRFLLIEGEARLALSDIFAEAAEKRGLDPAGIDKQRKKPMRSPLIIIVIARIQEAPAVPEIEQILCAGAAAQHIQLACRRLGYGSIWLTGDNSYDLFVHQSLGLEIEERVIGFLYVGTPDKPATKKIRAEACSVTQRWDGPQMTEFAI